MTNTPQANEVSGSTSLSPTPSGESPVAWRFRGSNRNSWHYTEDSIGLDGIRYVEPLYASSSASPKGDEDRELRSLQDEIERVIIRRHYNNRIVGYTLEMAREIAALSEASGDHIGDVNEMIGERSSNPSKCEREAEKEGDGRAVALEELLSFEPRLVAVGCEPCLRSIIFGYYRRHFDEGRAEELAKQYIAALSKREARPSKEGDARVWFEIIEGECLDLRCVAIPTGGDDADVGWQVISHYQAEPKERIIGRGESPIEALQDAAKNDDGVKRCLRRTRKSPSADRGGQP